MQHHDDNTKFEMRCPKCGSPNIARDASVRWSYDEQAWILSGLQDNIACQDCGADEIDGRRVAIDESEFDPGQRRPCPGHKFAYTGTQYGGDDDRFHGEGRAYCEHCGADGDA